MLSGFTTWMPSREEAASPLCASGVFVIARYVARESPQLELLICEESESMQEAAAKIMSEKQFDGVDRSIVYLIFQSDLKEQRKAILSKLRSSGIPGS
jgi:hypothetical protein